MNDNDLAKSEPSPAPDPHGQAALLLVESLIHGLCENSTITIAQAVQITQRAVDVQIDWADEADVQNGPMWRSHALLSAILASLTIDGGGSPSQPRLV